MKKEIFSTIFLLGWFAAAAFAQSSADDAADEAHNIFFNTKKRSIEIERVKREAYKQTIGENFTANFPQIKEDFEQIQKINDKFHKLAADKQPPEEATVVKLAAEINRRAVRLNSNLFPAASERKKSAKNKQSGDEPPNRKKLLAALDHAVNRFAHSSLFQNINLVDAADSLKAQNDLETVISLSARLKTKIKN